LSQSDLNATYKLVIFQKMYLLLINKLFGQKSIQLNSIQKKRFTTYLEL